MMHTADYRMPTVEEVLGGETQGGVPRPRFSFDPAEVSVLETKSFSAAEIAAPALRTRWQAVKALLRIIFRGDYP